MPSLIRSERQTLRDIQQHILALKIRAGASYQQISTVGVLFHPDSTQSAFNLVTPHQGVAWTRSEDLHEAFDLLEARGRRARLQYLRGLFPEAFERQLSLYGLEREETTPIWVYSPIQGPFPQHETPFGQLRSQDYRLEDFSVEVVETRERTSDWLRTYRSAAYDVDVTGADRVELELLRNEQKQNHSILLLGSHHQTPIAAGKITLHDEAAEIEEPVIFNDWSGMGFEDALLAEAVKMLLKQERRTLYIRGNPSFQKNLFLRMGFVQMTQSTTFVRVSKPNTNS